jgi:AAA domain
VSYDESRPFGFSIRSYFDSAEAVWVDPEAEEIPFGEQISVDLAGIAEEIAERNYRDAAKKKPEPLSLIGLADLAVRDVDWLDKGYVPERELTIVQGHGGVGKGPWTIGLAADVTRGKTPDGRPGAVLFAAAEDDPGSVVKPRLLAAGADMSLVDQIEEITLPDDLERLEATIVEYALATGVPVRLVVLDPILSHLSGKVDSYKDHEVKRALKPLVSLLNRTGTTGIGVHHLTKDTTRGAGFAGQASGAFRNTARSVLVMAIHDEDDRIRLLEVVKSNFARVGVGRRYRLELVKVAGVKTEQPVLVDDGVADKSVDAALSGAIRERAEVPRAQIREFIRRELADGAKTREHLNARAKDELGVSADALYKRGLSPMKDAEEIQVLKGGVDGRWSWRLADEEVERLAALAREALGEDEPF